MKSKLILQSFPSSKVVSGQDPLKFLQQTFNDWVEDHAGATLVKDQTSSCVDNSDYQRGGCAKWGKKDCYGAKKNGYTEVDQRELLSNCQVQCNVCCSCAGDIEWTTEPSHPTLVQNGHVDDREVFFIATNACGRQLKKSAMFIVTHSFQVLGYDESITTPPEPASSDDARAQKQRDTETVIVTDEDSDKVSLKSFRAIIPLCIIPAFMLSFGLAWYAHRRKRLSEFDINNSESSIWHGPCTHKLEAPLKKHMSMSSCSSDNTESGIGSDYCEAANLNLGGKKKRKSLMAKTFLTSSSTSEQTRNLHAVFHYDEDVQHELSQALNKAKEWSQEQDAQVRRWSFSDVPSDALVGETIYSCSSDSEYDNSEYDNDIPGVVVETLPKQKDILLEAVTHA